MNASKTTSRQRRTRANVVRENEKNLWNDRKALLDKIRMLVVDRDANHSDRIEEFIRFITNNESNVIDREDNTYCFLLGTHEDEAKGHPIELTSSEFELIKMFVNFIPEAGPIGDIRRNLRIKGALNCFLQEFDDCLTLEGENEKLMFFPFFLWANGHEQLSVSVLQDMLTNKGRLENCSLVVDSVGIYLQRNTCIPQCNREWIPSNDSEGNNIFFWLNKKYVVMFKKLGSGRYHYQLLNDGIGKITPKKVEIEFCPIIPLLEEFHYLLFSRISRSNVNALLWAEWERDSRQILDKFQKVKCKKCQKPMGVFGAIYAALYWVPVLNKSRSIDVENEACCWDCSSFSDMVYNAKLIKNVLNTGFKLLQNASEPGFSAGIATNVEIHSRSVMEGNLTNDVASSSTDSSSNRDEIVQHEEDCTSDNETEKAQGNNHQIGQPSGKVIGPLEQKSARTNLKRKGQTKRRRYSPSQHEPTRKSKATDDNRLDSANVPCSSGSSESQAEPIISQNKNRNKNRRWNDKIDEGQETKRRRSSRRCHTGVDVTAGSSNSGLCLNEVKPTQNLKTSTDEVEEEAVKPKDDIDIEKEVEEDESIIPLPTMEGSSTSSLTSFVEDDKFYDPEGVSNKDCVKPEKSIGTMEVVRSTTLGTKDEMEIQSTNEESVVSGDSTEVKEENIEDETEKKSNTPNTASPAALQIPADSVQSDPDMQVAEEKWDLEQYRLSGSFSNSESLKSVGNTSVKNASMSPSDVAPRDQPTGHQEHQLVSMETLSVETTVPLTKSDKMFSVNTGVSSNEAKSEDSSNIANQVEDPVKTVKNKPVGEYKKEGDATVNGMSAQSSPVYSHESPLPGDQRTFVTHKENGIKQKCFTISYILSIGTSQSNSDVERGANLKFDQVPLSGSNDVYQKADDANYVDPRSSQDSTPSGHSPVSTKKSEDGYFANDTILGTHDTALLPVRSEHDISSLLKTSSHSDSEEEEGTISNYEDAYFDPKSIVDDVPMGDVEPMATETPTTKGSTVAVTDDVECSFGQQNTLNERKLIEEPEKETRRCGSIQDDVDDDAEADDNYDDEDGSDGDDRSLNSVASMGKQNGQGFTLLHCGREITDHEKESIDSDDEDNLKEESSDDDGIDNKSSMSMQNSARKDSENKPVNSKGEDELVEFPDDDVIDNAGSESIPTSENGDDEKDAVDSIDEEMLTEECPDVVIDNPNLSMQSPKTTNDEKEPMDEEDEERAIEESPGDDAIDNPDCVSIQNLENTSTAHGISSLENEPDKDSSAVNCLGKDKDISSHSSNNQCDDIEEDDEEERSLEPTKSDENDEKELEIAESSDDERDVSNSLSDCGEVADEREKESEERMLDDSYIPGSSVKSLDARTTQVDEIETIQDNDEISEGTVNKTPELDLDSSCVGITEMNQNKVMPTSGSTICGTPVCACENIVTGDHDQRFQRHITDIEGDTYGDSIETEHSLAERTEDFSSETPEDNCGSSDESENQHKRSSDSPIVSPSVVFVRPQVELDDTAHETRAEQDEPIAFSDDVSKGMVEPEEPESMAVDYSKVQETTPEYNMETNDVIDSTRGNISAGDSSAPPSVTSEKILEASDTEASRGMKYQETQSMCPKENRNRDSTESQYEGNKTKIAAEHQKADASFQDKQNIESFDPTDSPTTKRAEEPTQVQHSYTNREGQTLEKCELNRGESSLWNLGRETAPCLEKYREDEHHQNSPDEAKDSDAPNLVNMNPGSLFTVKENQSGQLPEPTNSAKENMIDYFSAPQVSVKDLFEDKHLEKYHLLGSYMEKMEKDVENFKKQTGTNTGVLLYTTIPLTETKEHMKSYNKKDVETLYTEMVLEKEKVYNNLKHYNRWEHHNMETDLKDDIEPIVTQNLDGMIELLREKYTEWSKKIEELNSECCIRIETIRKIWDFRTIGLFGKMTADDNVSYLTGDQDGLDSSSQTKEIYEDQKLHQTYLKTLIKEICEQNRNPFALVLSEESTKSVQDEAANILIEPTVLGSYMEETIDDQLDKHTARITSTVTQLDCVDRVSQQQLSIDQFPIADLDKWWLKSYQNMESTSSNEIPDLSGNSDDITSTPGCLSGQQSNPSTSTPSLPTASNSVPTTSPNLEYPSCTGSQAPFITFDNNTPAQQGYNQTQNVWTPSPLVLNRHLSQGPEPNVNPSGIFLQHSELPPHPMNAVPRPLLWGPPHPHHAVNPSAPNHHGFPPVDQNNMDAHHRSFLDSQPGQSNRLAQPVQLPPPVNSRPKQQKQKQSHGAQQQNRGNANNGPPPSAVLAPNSNQIPPVHNQYLQDIHQIPFHHQLGQPQANPHFPQQLQQHLHLQRQEVVPHYRIDVAHQGNQVAMHQNYQHRPPVLQQLVLDERQRYQQLNHQQQLQRQHELQMLHYHNRLHLEQHRQLPFQQNHHHQQNQLLPGPPEQQHADQGNWEQIQMEPMRQIQQNNQFHQWMLQNPTIQQQPQRLVALPEEDDEVQIIGEHRVQIPRIQQHFYNQDQRGPNF